MKNKFFLIIIFMCCFILINYNSYSEDLNPQNVLEKYDEIMAPENLEAKVTLISKKNDEIIKTLKIRVLKKGEDKFRLWFESPQSVKNQEMLRNGTNLWTYFPNIKKAIRVANRDSFQNGDFNNSDILSPTYSHIYEANFSNLEETNLYHLILTSKDKTSAYDKIDLWMNKKNFMPVKAEYYASSGKLLRSAVFDNYKNFTSNYMRPAKITMHNEIIKEKESILVLDSINFKADFQDEKFNINNLGN